MNTKKLIQYQTLFQYKVTRPILKHSYSKLNFKISDRYFFVLVMSFEKSFDSLIPTFGNLKKPMERGSNDVKPIRYSYF